MAKLSSKVAVDSVDSDMGAAINATIMKIDNKHHLA